MTYGIPWEKITLKAYKDADWVGRMDDKKITSGGALFLGKFVLSWLRKKKISLSIYYRSIVHFGSLLLYEGYVDEAKY